MGSMHSHHPTESRSTSWIYPPTMSKEQNITRHNNNSNVRRQTKNRCRVEYNVQCVVSAGGDRLWLGRLWGDRRRKQCKTGKERLQESLQKSQMGAA